jgi:hypothetical protein
VTRIRSEDVARGVVVLASLEGDIGDAPLVSVELLAAPLVLSVLDDVLVAPLVAPFDVLLGELLLDASGDVLLFGVLVPDVLESLLGAGGARLTSPPDVFVTVPRCAAALLGMQSVVNAEPDVAPLVDADMPLVEDALPVADARAAAESAGVSGGVVPVPFAPFVLFRPVNR